MLPQLKNGDLHVQSPLPKGVSSKKMFHYDLFFHYMSVFTAISESSSGIQVQIVTGPADPSLGKQLFTAPSLIERRQLQLGRKGRVRAPPSLHFFIFLSVCLKNQGKNNLHGRGLTISAIIRMPSATPRTSRNNREKSFHLYVRVCAGYSPRVKAIYSSTVAELHSSCQLARLPVEADRPAASSGHLDQLKGHVCHISHDHADVVSLTYL